jgi:MoxR-like ATPase
MSAKWSLDELTVGRVMESTLYPNRKEGARFRFQGTHLDGRRAPKVVLSDDPAIVTGEPCLVKIERVEKPDRDDHGFIEVSFVQKQELRLEGVYLDPLVSRKLQVFLESGVNILLDGPQGCGKTVLARAVADALEMEFVFFNCSAVIEATDFLATLQIRAGEDGNPLTGFIKTELLEALERATANPGTRTLVFLDELNRCQESARNALMPALDASRRIFNPVDNTFLDIPDNVLFIAAVNRGSEFTGTFGIDAAQLDRFAPLAMDYPPPDAEMELLARRHPELSGALIRRVVDAADAVRAAPEVGGLSVRATDEVCLALKHPLMATQQREMLPELLKDSFCGRFSGRWSDPGTDAGLVHAICERALAGSKPRE